MRDDQWRHVADLSDIDDDTNLIGVKLDDTPVCLYRVNGVIHATHDMCTHGQARLSEGWLEDGTIECPLHQGVFDVCSGKPITPPVTKPVEVFETRVDGDKVYVRWPVSE